MRVFCPTFLSALSGTRQITHFLSGSVITLVYVYPHLTYGKRFSNLNSSFNSTEGHPEIRTSLTNESI